MSYNGIGLSTARGSGTNGYIQRNLSTVRRAKDRVDYKNDDQVRELDSRLDKKPNAEILLHEKKRKVEIRCCELESLMETQGYEKEKIDEKVTAYRAMLLKSNG